MVCISGHLLKCSTEYKTVSNDQVYPLQTVKIQTAKRVKKKNEIEASSQFLIYPWVSSINLHILYIRAHCSNLL